MNTGGVLRGRWRLALHTLVPGRGRARGAQPLIGIVLLLVLGGTLFAAFDALFAGLAAGVIDLQPGAMLSLVFTAALVGLVVFDLHYAVGSLLLDSDLELLRRAPITNGQLIALKLLDGMPRTSLLLLALVVPAVIAFARSFPLPPWAWLALPFQLAAMWAIPLALGVAGALGLVRLVPARHARDALALLSTLLLTLLWFANSFLLPRLGENAETLPRRIGESLTHWNWVLVLSPGAWAARALVAGADRDPARASLATLSLVVVAIVAILVAGRLAALSLDQALGQVTGAAGTRSRVARARRSAAPPRGGVLAAMLRKDSRLFRRDWTLLSDVLTAAVLWTLLPLTAAPVFETEEALLARAMMLMLAIGLGYEIAARSVPFERAGLAWTRLAPVAARRWVTGKLLASAALSLPLLGLAAGLLAMRVALPAEVWGRLSVAAISALGLSLSLGLWTGAAFGDPEWSNPRAMLSLAGRIVASALLVIQAALWLGLLWLADLHAASLPPGLRTWAPPLLALVLAFIPLAAASRRLGRLE